MSMKNSKDTVGNRIRDFPVCSSVLRHRVPRMENYSIKSNGKCLKSVLNNITFFYVKFAQVHMAAFPKR
jgi:hypothetical protein